MTSTTHHEEPTAPHDDGELRELMVAMRPALISYATKLNGGDRSAAEDVVQEAYIRVWRSFEKLRSRDGSLRAWLMRVTHNLVIDAHRAAKARPAQPSGVAADLPTVTQADGALFLLDRLIIQSALSRLDRLHREALIETFLRDRTVVEAAAVLHVPVGTVKSRVFYGLRQLRNDDEVCRLLDHRLAS